MKPLFFVTSWFVTTFFTLALALTSLVYLTYPRNTVIIPFHYQSFKALPQLNQDEQTVTIGKADGRKLLVAQFFNDHNAPMAEYADQLVNTADRYGLDYRLMPAIAMQESSGGKKMPKDSNNPFGFGIYGGKVTSFTSLPEAIDKVGRTLKQDYINQGLVYPYQIMTKYTPPSVALGGPWAAGVATFMAELQ